MQNKQYSIWLFILLIISLTGCSQGTGNNFGVLGFLPSGIKTATGHKLLYNTDYTIVTLIPGIEVIIFFFISLLCNIIDFMLWFIAWIPGLKQLIAVIYSAPDIDLLFRTIFHTHRNFITHSVLNPLLLIILIPTFIFGKFFKWLKNIACFVILLFMLHFFADAMPIKWAGFANIYIGIGPLKLFYLPPFLSKLWLMVNALACLYIAGKLAE